MADPTPGHSPRRPATVTAVVVLLSCHIATAAVIGVAGILVSGMHAVGNSALWIGAPLLGAAIVLGIVARGVWRGHRLGRAAALALFAALLTVSPIGIDDWFMPGLGVWLLIVGPVAGIALLAAPRSRAWFTVKSRRGD